MKIVRKYDEFADVLTKLIEAGLVDVVLGDDREAEFALNRAIIAEGPDAIAALLTGIEAITGSHNGA